MLAGLVMVLEQIGVRGLVVLIDEVERVLRLPQPATRMAAYMTLQNLISAVDDDLRHMPDLEALTQPVAPRPSSIPCVVVTLPPLASYDALLEPAS
jgi:hypothetical protein